MYAFYALMFAAVIMTTTFGSTYGRVGRQGWGAPPPHHSVELALTSEAAGVGEGTAGAGQSALLAAQGAGWTPADIGSSSGTGAGLSNHLDNVQLTNVGSDGTSTTSNTVSAGQQAAAGDHLNAQVTVGWTASVDNAGQSNSGGWGATSAQATSHNQVNNVGGGW